MNQTLVALVVSLCVSLSTSDRNEVKIDVWLYITSLLCLSLPSLSSTGIFVLKKTPTFYQAEEDVNVAIGWDSPIMSLTILRCFFHSEPLKLFYEMVNGVESSESQHQQFAGRVQCDKDALREGRVRLHVSRVTTDDSGRYWCDLAANYDKIRRRWGLETTGKMTQQNSNQDSCCITRCITRSNSVDHNVIECTASR